MAPGNVTNDKVTVSVDGLNYTVNVNGTGVGKLIIPANIIGEHTVNVYFAENKLYNIVFILMLTSIIKFCN